MQDQIEAENVNTRKLKQEYLISRIIKENHDPEAFTEFLRERKPDGEDIDNWTLDELETEVLVFKRDKHGHMHDLLEGLELNPGDKCTYANRFKTAKKKKTVVGQNQARPIIESVEVKDGGLFSGRYIQFNLHTRELDLHVQRTEGEFKWLSESLKKEFPFIAVPPLVKINDKLFEDCALELKCRNFQKFLNDCANHPELKNSLVLEIFLTSQEKTDLNIKMKEIHKYFSQNVLIDKHVNKKRADYLNESPIKKMPTTQGTADLKITPLLQTHIHAANEQINQYETALDSLERCSQEFEKCFSKLISLHEEVQGIYKDLHIGSARYNLQKPRKSVWNLLEEHVYTNLENHFGHLCILISYYYSRSAKNIQALYRRFQQIPKGVHYTCERGH